MKSPTKLGNGLASLTASGPAVLATARAAEDDEIGSAMRLEQLRHERAVLDFEAGVRRARDGMTAEHLEIMRGILGQEAE